MSDPTGKALAQQQPEWIRIGSLYIRPAAIDAINAVAGRCQIITRGGQVLNVDELKLPELLPLVGAHFVGTHAG